MIASYDDVSFDQLLASAQNAVLVDFGAPWCGPCKMVEPALEEVARALGGQLSLAKIDIEASPVVAGRHRVRALPTLVLFRGGKVLGSRVGAASASTLLAWVRSLLPAEAQPTAG